VPDLLETSVSVDTVRVPVPEVDVGETTIQLPDIPGFETPDLTVPDVTVRSVPVNLGSASLPVPEVEVDTADVFLPPLPSFPYVSFVDVGLDVEYAEIDIPLTDIDPVVPVSVELVGPTVEFGRFDPPDYPTIPVPNVTVRTVPLVVDLGRASLPDVSVTNRTIRLPDVESVRLPAVAIPSLAVRVVGYDVPDPASIRVEVRLKLAALRETILEPVPTGLLTQPGAWVLETVLTEAAKRVDSGLADRLVGIAGGLLESSLEPETRERLRERRRDDGP
jgi:hypothetical protein